MPPKKGVKASSSKDILLEFSKFKETIGKSDKLKNVKPKKQTKTTKKEQKLENEDYDGSITLVITEDLIKKAQRELNRLEDKPLDLETEDTLNSEDEIVTKDPKTPNANVVDLEEIIASKKDESSSEESEEEEVDSELEELERLEEKRIIVCDECQKDILRDSEEHDNMICDTEGKLWFCLKCTDEPEYLMENHNCVLMGYEDFKQEEEESEKEEEESEKEEIKNEDTEDEVLEDESDDELEIDTEEVHLKNGMIVYLNLQNKVLYKETEEGDYEIYGKASETKSRKYDFICQNVKYLIK